MNIDQLAIFNIFCIINSTRFHIADVTFTKNNLISICNKTIIRFRKKLNRHLTFNDDSHVITRM